MTAQITDTIMINDDQHAMYGLPLEDYWKKYGNKPPLFGGDTASKRGYQARWMIENSRLYLYEFYGTTMNPETIWPLIELSLEDIFADTDKVFASWYTGHITIPMGAQVDYIHAGPGGAVFEYRTTIHFENGVVVDPGMFVME
jgi:hypothetical protein